MSVCVTNLIIPPIWNLVYTLSWWWHMIQHILMQQNQMLLPKSKFEVPQKWVPLHTPDTSWPSWIACRNMHRLSIPQQSHVGIALQLQTTWKATNGLVVCVHMEQCDCHWTDSCEILYLGLLLKLDKNNRHSTWRPTPIYVTDLYNGDGVCFLWGTNEAQETNDKNKRKQGLHLKH